MLFSSPTSVYILIYDQKKILVVFQIRDVAPGAREGTIPHGAGSLIMKGLKRLIRDWSHQPGLKPLLPGSDLGLITRTLRASVAAACANQDCESSAPPPILKVKGCPGIGKHVGPSLTLTRSSA